MQKCMAPTPSPRAFPSTYALLGDRDRYRTLLRRFGAALIDLWVSLPIVFPGLMPVSWRSGSNFVLLITAACWLPTLYFVSMHAAYGQTIGKRICRVRVVDARTEGWISWRQAVRRELPVIAFCLVVTAFNLLPHSLGTVGATILIHAARIVSICQNPWYLLDAVWTLTNQRRRSLHDLIGGTVVVRTD